MGSGGCRHFMLVIGSTYCILAAVYVVTGCFCVELYMF